jgi:hypothetical protein
VKGIISLKARTWVRHVIETVCIVLCMHNM